MPYLDEETLRAATERLGVSRAAPRLADFLIFRRAAVRTVLPATPSNGALSAGAPIPPPDAPTPTTPVQVMTGTRSAAFVYAIEELALAVPFDELDSWGQQPFFLPFGARRDKAHGYKSAKYPSNGPDNTAAGWQTQTFTPVRLVPDTSPRQWTVETGTEEQLANFLLVRSSSAENFSGEKPRLLDAAVWWHRFTLFDDTPTEEQLVERFVQGLELPDVERVAVFEALTGAEAGSVSYAPEQAAPASYLPAGPAPTAAAATPAPAVAATGASPQFEHIQHVIDYVASQGYTFEPWQIAAYITAVRTKPFVILAGISGTGKTKLPRLIAEATGASFAVVPVQANWNDSSDLIGYERLTGDYVPGHLLRLASSAQDDLDVEQFLLLDEMNIARVEYYLAEVLSLIEERRRNADGIIQSDPLAPSASDDWSGVGLPSNLCVVGSVNMDETTFGFSRKVLDRSFVIEFSTIDLDAVGNATAPPPVTAWPAEWWRQPALNLAEHPDRGSPIVATAIENLRTINDALAPAQLQVGYRVRDEVAMFCLHAQPYAEAFSTHDSSPVDPLDLAITMKVLPRVQGGGPTIRGVLTDLLDWANGGTDAAGSPTAATGTAFPMSADRISLMLDRLADTGFTSYWL